MFNNPDYGDIKQTYNTAIIIKKQVGVRYV